MSIEQALDEIERLRSAIEAIQQAALEGRVCSDADHRT
jgi:hypothetical protein